MAKADTKKSSGKKSKSKGKKASGSALTKTVKKSGVMDLLNSNLGREILADALIAAAGAAAAALTRTRTAQQAGAAVADMGSRAAEGSKDAVQTAAGAVAGVVTEAARQFLPASLVGETDEAQGAKSSPKKVKYVHRASDHSARKKSKKDEKAGKR